MRKKAMHRKRNMNKSCCTHQDHSTSKKHAGWGGIILASSSGMQDVFIFSGDFRLGLREVCKARLSPKCRRVRHT